MILGATGLVGGECLRLAQANQAFERIVVLTRRPLADELLGPKVEQHIVNFDHLTASSHLFAVNQIICALGTTMKHARTRRAFRTVDLLYPLTAAHLGIEKRVSHFLVVSALGADPRSPIFYNRIKGELEKGLTSLPYRSLTIARPSILLGKRARPRTGERIAAGISFLTPARLRPIEATDVAAALLQQAVVDEAGLRVLDSADLRKVGRAARSSHSSLDASQPITEARVETSVA